MYIGFKSSVQRTTSNKFYRSLCTNMTSSIGFIEHTLDSIKQCFLHLCQTCKVHGTFSMDMAWQSPDEWSLLFSSLQTHNQRELTALWNFWSQTHKWMITADKENVSIGWSIYVKTKRYKLKTKRVKTK